MELAAIIEVLYEHLINNPIKICSYALDDEMDRVKLFKALVEAYREEMRNE